MRHTLLIVDDEPPIREVLRRTVRHEPLDVLEAGSADEALSLIRERPVDVLISDQNMPGLTGMDLMQRLRVDHPGIVRIILTGQGDARFMSQAIADEIIYHYVLKPWDDAEMSLVLKLAVRHREALRENERLLGLVKTQRRIIGELEEKARPPG